MLQPAWALSGRAESQKYASASAPRSGGVRVQAERQNLESNRTGNMVQSKLTQTPFRAMLEVGEIVVVQAGSKP